jgi:hypothetical protein
MKMLTKIFATILVFVVVLSCENTEEPSTRQFVDLKFQTATSTSGFLVLTNVQILKGRLISTELRSIDAVHSITGQKVVAYIVAETNARGGQLARMESTRCYIFTGHCLEYGTLITDTVSEVQLFFPADNLTKSLGFHDICPAGGSEWA